MLSSFSIIAKDILGFNEALSTTEEDPTSTQTLYLRALAFEQNAMLGFYFELCLVENYRY
jgi:hypothetical protein